MRLSLSWVYRSVEEANPDSRTLSAKIVGGLVSGISGGVAGWTIIGAVYGATTGSVLVWLLPRRPGAP